MSSSKLKRNRILITLGVSLFLILGTTATIFLARGYRPNPQKGLTSFKGTGLLSATSHPKSAQVFLDGELITATDDTLNLPPGNYTVKITLEGFLPWEKQLTINKELVTTTNARLFPAVPSLSALTYTGISSPLPSPDGKKVAFLVSNQEPLKNGLYILSIGNSLLGSNSPTQLTISPSHDFTTASFAFSPNSKNILILFNDKKGNITNSYLINTDDTITLANIPDSTIRLPLIFSEWEEDLVRIQQNSLAKLPDFMVNVASSSANTFISPNGEKLLYTASQNLLIPEKLTDPLDSTNSTPQTRNIQIGQTYIYDSKEDTNYLLGPAPKTKINTKLLTPLASTSESTASASTAIYNQLQEGNTPLETLNLLAAHYTPSYTLNPAWYQTSNHLISTADNKISIFEYDNLNHTPIYSGPFQENFAISTPGGDKLIILTNLNQDDSPPNLYSLDLQ